MKRFLFLISLFCLCTAMQAQVRKHTTFYDQRATLFETLPTSKDDIIFLGNSITNGVLDRLHVITAGKPSKVFLLIGTNDLAGGLTVDSIAKNIETIVKRIKKESPATRVYLQSVLPLNPVYNMFTGHMKRQADVPVLNELLKKVAKRNRLTYIDLYAAFINPNTNEMNADYSNDGLHLLGKGYQKWAEIIKPYVAE